MVKHLDQALKRRAAQVWAVSGADLLPKTGASSHMAVLAQGPDDVGHPSKRFYRSRAHSNPLNDSHFPVPTCPAEVDWYVAFHEYLALQLRPQNPSVSAPRTFSLTMRHGYSSLSSAA